MKTDDLIKVLSTNVEPVDRWQVAREIVSVVVIGTATAVGAALLISGLRTDLGNVHAVAFLALKLALAVSIVVIGSIYLLKFSRPGAHATTNVAAARLPIVAITALAVISLMLVPLWHWHDMALGEGWLECLVSIPLIAIVPFALVVWVVRRMAPTNLMLTGALAGLVAGGMSATGYALHCTDDSLPFIALWYGGAIALCALAGAALGPRLLRW